MCTTSRSIPWGFRWGLQTLRKATGVGTTKATFGCTRVRKAVRHGKQPIGEKDKRKKSPRPAYHDDTRALRANRLGRCPDNNRARATRRRESGKRPATRHRPRAGPIFDNEIDDDPGRAALFPVPTRARQRCCATPGVLRRPSRLQPTLLRHSAQETLDITRRKNHPVAKFSSETEAYYSLSLSLSYGLFQ